MIAATSSRTLFRLFHRRHNLEIVVDDSDTRDRGNAGLDRVADTQRSDGAFQCHVSTRDGEHAGVHTCVLHTYERLTPQVVLDCRGTAPEAEHAQNDQCEQPQDQ